MSINLLDTWMTFFQSRFNKLAAYMVPGHKVYIARYHRLRQQPMLRLDQPSTKALPRRCLVMNTETLLGRITAHGSGLVDHILVPQVKIKDKALYTMSLSARVARRYKWRLR